MQPLLRTVEERFVARLCVLAQPLADGAEHHALVASARREDARHLGDRREIVGRS